MEHRWVMHVWSNGAVSAWHTRNRGEQVMNTPEYDLRIALRASEAELTTLKRQHKRLRAAAQTAITRIGECDATWALRAALNATPAEPTREAFDSTAVRELLAVISAYPPSANPTLAKHAQIVRDSEHKP